MRTSYILQLSIGNLKNRKLRSFLTVGGMMIGIGSIVFLVSLGFGLQRLVVSQIANVEALTVLDVTTGSSALLAVDNDTIESIAKVEGVTQISPSINLSGQIKYQNFVTDLVAFAIDPQFIVLEGVDVIQGDIFAPDQGATVISTTLADLLGFPNSADAVGQTVKYELLSPSTSAGAESEVKILEVVVTGVIDDELAIGFLPLDVVRELGFSRYNLVRVKIADQNDLVPVRSQIESLGYQVDSVADTVGQIDRIFFAFQIVMAALGFIAMFVASLGTFNTLTVSLLERTREIGIMKSIGATRKDIYFMFMVESVVIGFFGAFLGVIVGIFMGWLLNIAINMLASRYGGSSVDVFYTPLIFIFLLFAGVFLMSVITGVYPARRAAKLNPLDAIRYE